MSRRIRLFSCLILIPIVAVMAFVSIKPDLSVAQPTAQPNANPKGEPTKTAQPDKALPPQQPGSAIQRWEYLRWTSADNKLSFDLNKFGADGWELVVAHPNMRFEVNGKHELILKRPQRPPTTQEARLVGFWQLVDGDKQGLSELMLECTAYKTVVVTARTKEGGSFEIQGQYEVIGDDIMIQFGIGRETLQSRDRIKKLTATELVLEDEKGKVEGYKRAK